MCNSFSNRGYDVKLLLPESGIKNPKKFINDKFGYSMSFKIIFYSRTYKNNKLEKYFGYAKMIEQIKKHNSDYVFTRIPNIVKYVIKLNRVLIFESHNNKLHERYKLIDFFLKRSLKKFSKKNNFLLFICISENLKKFWEECGINSKKTVALHDGFDMNKYANPKSKIQYRNMLNIESKKIIAVYTGSLYADRKIESIIYLAKKNKDVNFIVVGGPDRNRKKFNKKINNDNILNIDFVGRKNHKDIHKYLFAADILLALWSKDVPTIDYCSPLKLFEYMASGSTIISNDYITIREVLEDKKDAFLVNGERDEDLNETLKNIIENKSIKVGSSARKKALSLYSWDSRVDSISKLL